METSERRLDFLDACDFHPSLTVALVALLVILAAAVARRDDRLLLLAVRTGAGVIGLGLFFLVVVTRRRRALTTAGLSIHRLLCCCGLFSRCLALLCRLNDGLEPAFVGVGEAGLVVVFLERRKEG